MFSGSDKKLYPIARISHFHPLLVLTEVLDPNIEMVATLSIVPFHIADGGVRSLCLEW